MYKKSLIWALAAAIAFLIAAFAAVMGLFEPVNTAVYKLAEAFENDLMTKAMLAVSNAYSAYMPLSCMLLAVPRTRLRIGAPMFFASFLSWAGTSFLKGIFKIPRPEGRRLSEAVGYGFPSGHAMAAAAIFILVCFFLKRSSLPKAAKMFFAAQGGAYMALSGISRVYLRVHSAIDIIGGYLAGICLALSIIAIIEAIEAHGQFWQWSSQSMGLGDLTDEEAP